MMRNLFDPDKALTPDVLRSCMALLLLLSAAFLVSLVFIVLGNLARGQVAVATFQLSGGTGLVLATYLVTRIAVDTFTKSAHENTDATTARMQETASTNPQTRASKPKTVTAAKPALKTNSARTTSAKTSTTKPPTSTAHKAKPVISKRSKAAITPKTSVEKSVTAKPKTRTATKAKTPKPKDT